MRRTISHNQSLTRKSTVVESPFRQLPRKSSQPTEFQEPILCPPRKQSQPTDSYINRLSLHQYLLPLNKLEQIYVQPARRSPFRERKTLENLQQRRQKKLLLGCTERLRVECESRVPSINATRPRVAQGGGKLRQFICGLMPGDNSILRALALAESITNEVR